MTTTLLTPRDMSQRLGAPESTVMKWNRDYGWPHVRVGRRIRWSEEQYDEIVRSRSVGDKPRSPLSARTARRRAS